MGTNYYVYVEENCPNCGEWLDTHHIHIGKSSGGWEFALCIHPSLELNNIADWLAYLPDKKIKDEYGEEVSFAEMIDVIANRGRDESIWEEAPFSCLSWDAFHRDNHSQRGEKGLLSPNFERSNCVPGEGTWYYIQGEFS